MCTTEKNSFCDYMLNAISLLYINTDNYNFLKHVWVEQMMFSRLAWEFQSAQNREMSRW